MAATDGRCPLTGEAAAVREAILAKLEHGGRQRGPNDAGQRFDAAPVGGERFAVEGFDGGGEIVLGLAGRVGGDVARRSKDNFIGRGMHLEFAHPDYLPITTSRVVGRRERAA